MPVDPKGYWPLVRFADEDFTDDPGAGTYFFTDAEMIAIRLALRTVCRVLPNGEKYEPLFESAREKIEQVLDLEFNEGRFAGGDVQPGTLTEAE